MLREGGEEKVAELRFDTRPIDRPRSQGTPDLLHPATLQYEDTAGEPVAQVLAVLCPWGGQRLVDEYEQLLCGIPFLRFGWSYDDFHDLERGAATLLLMALCAGCWNIRPSG